MTESHSLTHLSLSISIVKTSKTQDFSEQVLKLTGSKGGVDVLIDFIGASYWEKNLKSLARDGRMVLLGLMGGAKTETPLDLSQILFKRLRIEGEFSYGFLSSSFFLPKENVFENALVRREQRLTNFHGIFS